MYGVGVLVLRADGEEGGVGLEPGFDEEEGGADGCADDPGGGAGEEVDEGGLYGGVAVGCVGEEDADGLVEAETAAV